MAEVEKGVMFEYFVPIESKAELNGDFTINGTAISETITSNGHKFISEELSKAASTLIGVPLLKDHDNSVDSIVGKVKVAHFDENARSIPFTAVVKDPKMVQLIKDGLLSTVSIGADVRPEDIEEIGDGEVIPHNITFKELSLVAIPADDTATFTIALKNAFKLHSTKIERGDNMTEEKEEKSKEESDKSEESKEVPEEKEEEAKEEVEKVDEEKAIDEKIKALEIKAKKRKLAKLLEADADEVEKKEKEVPEEKEEDEEEEKDEDEDEEVEEKGDYKITNGYNFITSERKSYVYN